MHTLLTTTHLTAPAYDNDYGTTVTLPVGRIVWGHPGKPKPATDNHGNPKLDKSGQQMQETSFGLAIPTDVFNAEVWPQMHAEASKLFQNVPGGFSWKMTQSTEVDKNGKLYSEREGYAGCVVLAISTMVEPPRMLKWNGTQWVQMNAEEVKCGDYVQPEVTFKVNKPSNPTHTPGLYVNPNQIAFIGYGDEIVSIRQTDPSQAFGNGPPPLPPGASATPVAGGAPMPGAPGQAPAPQPGNAPMPGAPTTAPPANTAGQPPAASAPPAPANPAPPPPPPAAPAEPQRPTDPAHIHDNGNGTEQWVVNGAWDGGSHPIPQPATLPPPATGFVDAAAGGTPTMPGAPPPR